MSYEGFDEYLCGEGHYFCIDYMEVTYGEGVPKACKCGAPWKWFHRVDETNGHDPRYPSTFAAPRDDTGEYTEEERVDHHGNKYMVKHELFKPKEGSAWGLLEDIQRKQAEMEADREWRTRYYIAFHEWKAIENNDDFELWYIQRENGVWKKTSWLEEGGSEELLYDVHLVESDAAAVLEDNLAEILSLLGLTEISEKQHLLVRKMVLPK